MKKVFLGFLCGLSAALCLTVFAAQMEVINNPYKITVNGQEVNIEGYNIEGSTYFKLRDVGDAVGFDVDFQNDTIILTASQGKGGDRPSMTLEEFTAQINAKVESGEITQEQANQMIEQFNVKPKDGAPPHGDMPPMGD